MFYEYFVKTLHLRSQSTEKSLPNYLEDCTNINFIETYFYDFLKQDYLEDEYTPPMENNWFINILQKEGYSISRHLSNSQNPFSIIIQGFKEHFIFNFEALAYHFLNDANRANITDKNFYFVYRGYEDYNSETQRIIDNLKEFQRILITGILLFYDQIYDMNILNLMRDHILTMMADLIIEGKIYKILYLFLQAETYRENSSLMHKFKGLRGLGAHELGCNKYFCLNQISKLNEYLKPSEYNPMEQLLEERKMKKRVTVTFLDNERMFSSGSGQKSRVLMEDKLSSRSRSYIQEEVEESVREFESLMGGGAINMSVASYEELEESVPRYSFLHMEAKGSPASGWNTPQEELLINARMRKPPYLLPIHKLKEIAETESPIQKLDVLTKLNEYVCDSVDLFWKGIPVDRENLYIDADQLVSIYLYLIIQAGIPDFLVHLAIIDHFTPFLAKSRSAEYNLTTFKGCIYQLLDMDRSNFLEPVKITQAIAQKARQYSVASRSGSIHVPA